MTNTKTDGGKFDPFATLERRPGDAPERDGFNPWATLERQPEPPKVPLTESLEDEPTPADEPFDPWAPLVRR